MKKFLLICCTFLAIFAVFAADEAAYILLYDKEVVTVNPDGTSTTTDECRYKILNYEGLTQLRELSLHFNTAYGTIKVTHLAIVKPDGKRIAIDPAKNSSVNTEASQMNSEIFDPAQKVLSVSVPGLEIGDTLEITSFETITKPRLPGEFSDIAVLQANFPIKYYEYVIDMPAEKPLRSICIKDEEKGTITFSEKKVGKRIIYTWIARDVPQVVPESAMPKLYTCVQRVLTSTVKSWEDISRWYDQLCAPRLAKVSDEMRKKTAELTAGKKSDLEKITALFQFVSQQIRYTGITDEESAPGYEPHDVDQTFERRHGVCRDKAALLVAMLRLAGFKACPILFMSGTPKDKEVPNIYFNHAIAAVETAPGKYLLMDPTFETTTELFPGYLAGDSYLAAKPDGDTLRTAPAVKAESNLLKIKTAVDARSVPVKVKTVLDFSGIYDQMYRDAFSNWTKDDIRNFFAARARAILPGAELKNFTITPANVRDMSVPLSVTLEYSAHALFKDSPVPGLMPMPRGAFIFGLMDSLYANTALEKRRFPLQALPRAVSESITVSCDTGNYQITMPETLDLNEKDLFRVKIENHQDKNGISEKFFFAIDSMLVSPADYGKFKAASAVAKKRQNLLPVISWQKAYTADEANSELLNYTRRFNIIDRHNWTTTTGMVRKIRNYAGVKENANFSINYIDRLEKFEVTAVVTDSKGKKHTLSPKEINRMDAPATAGAPRYLKRKIAVISFPGVDAGSIIDCTVTFHHKDKPFFHTELVTANETPVKKEELIIDSPAQLKLNISPVPEKIKDSSTMGGKRIIRRYSAENMPGLPTEPGQPDHDLFVPTLRISAGGNLDHYTRINAAAQKMIDEASPEIAELAKKIAASAPEVKPDGVEADKFTKEQLRQISIAYAFEKYIYKHVRNVNLPLNDMRTSEYSLPQVTLRDGYGNSVDRAILLGAMLRSQGIRFGLIPVASTPAVVEKLDVQREYPENIYDKLLVRLTDHGLYLNDSGLYGTPGVIHSNNAIMLDSTKVTALHQPVSTAVTDIRSSIKVNKDLSASVTMQYRYGGRNLETLTEMFARLTPPLKKQYFEKLAAAVSPLAKITASEVDESGYYQITLKLQIPQFAERNGKFVTFALPDYGKITARAAIPARSRKAPYLINEDSKFNISYEIVTPANWKLCRQPVITSMHLPGWFWTGDYLFFRGAHLIEYTLNKKPDILYPPEFDQLLNLHKEINHINTENILFITE